MTDRYVAIHTSDCFERKLPGYDREPEHAEGWVLFYCDENGNPVNEVWSDGNMQPEDAILVRDLKGLVEELNAVAALADGLRKERDALAEKVRKGGKMALEAALTLKIDPI
jgi:hypothetical protein